MTYDEFIGARYLRVNRVRELQDSGRLDDDLRWQAQRKYLEGSHV